MASQILRQTLCTLAAVVLTGGIVATARAEPAPSRSDDTEQLAGNQPKGRPRVELDQLTFPDPAVKRRYEKYLRRVLAREARRADWGAGKGSTIEYRFAVEALSVVQRDSAIQVKCKALGQLPKGKSARGQLEYGGDPRHQTKLVKQVLEIVARGVITRLAELERVRRGQLHPERVRPPES